MSATPVDGSVAPADDVAFARLYAAHYAEVERWLRAFGTPPSEREDVAQEIFLVVRRKLDAFDGANLRGWLFAIAQRTASDHRRRAWFRHLFQRRAPLDAEALVFCGAGPAEDLERKELQQLLGRALTRLPEKQRTAFVLFEIEGYSGEEIAELLGVPLGSVWRRLHDARARFLTVSKALRAEVGR